MGDKGKIHDGLEKALDLKVGVGKYYGLGKCGTRAPRQRCHARGRLRLRIVTESHHLAAGRYRKPQLEPRPIRPAREVPAAERVLTAIVRFSQCSEHKVQGSTPAKKRFLRACGARAGSCCSYGGGGGELNQGHRETFRRGTQT
jgi:hypothetical protein